MNNSKQYIFNLAKKYIEDGGHRGGLNCKTCVKGYLNSLGYSFTRLITPVDDELQRLANDLEAAYECWESLLSINIGSGPGIIFQLNSSTVKENQLEYLKIVAKIHRLKFNAKTVYNEPILMQELI